MCIKKVLDPKGEIRLRQESGTFLMEGTKYILNPFDRYALELGLRLIDEGGGQIKAITVGPSLCGTALRECLMLGVDEAIHILPETYEILDPCSTSYCLSETIKKNEYDLLLCGKQSADDEWGQTGIWVAERLGIPHVSEVTDLQMKGGMAYCGKKVEGGIAFIETPLPALITVEKSTLDIRLPTVTGIMKEKKKSIKQVKIQSTPEPTVRNIRLIPSKPSPKRIFTPDSALPPIERIKMIMSAGIVKKSQSPLIEGVPKESAHKFFLFLKKEKII